MRLKAKREKSLTDNVIPIMYIYKGKFYCVFTTLTFIAKNFKKLNKYETINEFFHHLPLLTFLFALVDLSEGHGQCPSHLTEICFPKTHAWYSSLHCIKKENINLNTYSYDSRKSRKIDKERQGAISPR